MMDIDKVEILKEKLQKGLISYFDLTEEQIEFLEKMLEKDIEKNQEEIEKFKKRMKEEKNKFKK